MESNVGPWAREKLECLSRYLHEYTKILRKHPHLSYIYVDAFSGSGSHKLRKEPGSPVDQMDLGVVVRHLDDDHDHRQYIEGSPRVALGIEYPFQKYIFVEQNQRRVRALQGLQKDYPECEIYVRPEDCNPYIAQKLLHPKRSWTNLRAVVFLDPFGMQVPWRTIERIGETGSIEVLINFPVGMAIQRLLRRDGVFTPKGRRKLDQYFGSSDWYDVVYHRTKGLFGETLGKVPESNQALTRWYRQRLKRSFRFVSTARLIRSDSNHPLYYLIHAGPNQTGSRIANYILSQGETI